MCSLHECLLNRDLHRRAAGVYAGGAWQEQSSPGGTEDCHADKSTPGLKRPAQECNKWLRKSGDGSTRCSKDTRWMEKDLTRFEVSISHDEEKNDSKTCVSLCNCDCS